MKIANANTTFDRLMLATIADTLHDLLWLKTKDGRNGVNRPASIAQKLIGIEEKKQLKGFESGEEFLKAFSAITGE